MPNFVLKRLVRGQLVTAEVPEDVKIGVKGQMPSRQEPLHCRCSLCRGPTSEGADTATVVGGLLARGALNALAACQTVRLDTHIVREQGHGAASARDRTVVGRATCAIIA
jgi:hypothetical protein